MAILLAPGTGDAGTGQNGRFASMRSSAVTWANNMSWHPQYLKTGCWQNTVAAFLPSLPH